MGEVEGTSLTGDSGCYLLVIKLDGACLLSLGRRSVSLSAGFYGYVGSAQRALAARLARHRRPLSAKKSRWHIDGLLAHGRLEATLVWPLSRPGECWLAGRLLREPGVKLAARRFGSSDCRCPGHLVAFAKPPDLEAIKRIRLPKGLRLD